jgi:hypothetical protein
VLGHQSLANGFEQTLLGPSDNMRAPHAAIERFGELGRPVDQARCLMDLVEFQASCRGDGGEVYSVGL